MWKKIVESGGYDGMPSEEERVLSELESAYKLLSKARSILEHSTDVELREKYLRTIADAMNLLDYDAI